MAVELRSVHVWGAHEVTCERAQHGGGESERRCMTRAVAAGRGCLRLGGVGNGKALYMIYMGVVAVQCTRDGVWWQR